MAYAESTTVDSAKSRAELERLLERYGAEQFGYATRAGKAMVEFVSHDRRVRFIVELPDKADKAFTLTPTGKFKRSPAEALKAYEQATRQKWRALVLVVKAKLEAVDAGISTFEAEFLSNIVLPSGQTVYEQIAPGIQTAYETGRVSGILEIEA